MRESDLKFTKKSLELIYEKFNRREYVHPDPLEFLYRYADPAEREIVGLMASSLAYGRVNQILKSVEEALGRMEPAPRIFIRNSTPAVIRKRFEGFKHRFASGSDMAGFLIGVKSVIRDHGSLKDCFLSHYEEADESLLPAAEKFVSEITCVFDGECCHLAPSPEKGSACKRLNLFLRWMVRRDDVDPGGWDELPAAKLIMPLDTHIHRLSRNVLHITTRNQADLKAAEEITREFATISPEDPVKYDFALTRFGIRRNNTADPGL
ncbi:MAG TPA: TIGR02757 family protein [bacterium]|nr:TIGR02757 family protein [bacterium]